MLPQEVNRIYGNGQSFIKKHKYLEVNRLRNIIHTTYPKANGNKRMESSEGIHLSKKEK